MSGHHHVWNDLNHCIFCGRQRSLAWYLFCQQPLTVGIFVLLSAMFLTLAWAHDHRPVCVQEHKE